MIDAIIASVAVLTSVAAVTAFWDTERRRRARRGEPTDTFGERMERLTTGLRETSVELDKILEEIASVTRERESLLKRLEERVEVLTTQEEGIKERIEAIRSVPVPAADYLLGELEKIDAQRQRRETWRQFAFFVAGVVSTGVVSVVAVLFFG